MKTNTETVQQNIRQAHRCGRLKKPEVDALLAMYAGDSKTIDDIAQAFDVSRSYVIYTAKRAGLPARVRGNRPKAKPLPSTQQILLEAWTDTYANAAKRCGITKQRIGQIVKRWKKWAFAEFGPRMIASKSITKALKPPKRRREASPHVISFRVPNSIFTLLLARSASQSDSRSAHEAARSLLIEHVNCLSKEAASAIPG